MPSTYKNILCIRADNMGDVIMTGPALRALKESFPCRITLLTSRMGSLITPFIPEVDEMMVADLPWVRSFSIPSPIAYQELLTSLQQHQFDLAVIFTVYSQNPMPAAFLCWQAGIPERLAYCRENPYELLTKWIPDEEPYSFIRHQVERDLHLVEHIGAITVDDHLHLRYSEEATKRAVEKMRSVGLDTSRDWIILHPGVSEKKREYPLSLWTAATRLIRRETDLQMVVTGSSMDIELASSFGNGVLVAAGVLTIEEFISLVAASRLVISVNTAAIHIATAVDTPVIVLYAQTNPQHTPWKAQSKILEFSVDKTIRSRNTIIRHVSDQLYSEDIPFPQPAAILQAMRSLYLLV
jgi:ADP-heptose:LPS heptosyltransferase